jgi:hypothetical protein
MPVDIDAMRAEVRKHADDHTKWGAWDAWFYNGGTVVVLLCTSLATYLPAADSPVAKWLPQVMTGFATFWVALDRALLFGPRWRFHLTQASRYRAIDVQLIAHHGVPEPDKPAAMKKILNQLEVAHKRDSAMPGVHGASSE